MFVWQALNFGFYQDDAFISYRYVANYLHGAGLVYNVGERIEGYTNFGWVLGLILCGLAKINYIVVSRVVGVAFGAGAVLLTFFLAVRCLERRPPWAALLPTALVAVNLSLAYWAQSGLETAAFVFFMTLAIYLFVVRSWQLIAVLVAAVLIRPEGALLGALLILAELLIYKRRPLYSAACAGIAFLFSLPFVIFKLAYYGSLLPNPFYAKTAFTWEQVTTGWGYAVGFAGHYPFFAVGLLLLPFFWRELNEALHAIWVVAAGFTLYIVLIGGDVLMVHRFFLPILSLLAIAVIMIILVSVERLKPLLRYSLLSVFVLLSVVTSLWLPRAYILDYASREAGLVQKMGFFADRLKEIGLENFSVASTTIGRLGYELTGHRMIDMLGLTDSTIARHPEPFPEGLESTWRERSFNSPYLLAQAPDFIVFSTGLKPSAPAERVLLSYDQFLNCYRGATWYYQPTSVVPTSPLISVFRKMRPPQALFVPPRPKEFVNAYARGTNAQNDSKWIEAERDFKEALQLGGNPPYVYLLYRLAIVEFQLKHAEYGEALQNQTLEIDSTVAEVQADLYVYEYTIGNNDKAAIHRRWMEKLSPWLLPRYDSVAQARAQWYQARKSGRRR